jgi:predicted cupin superfamily sugar epimerase
MLPQAKALIRKGVYAAIESDDQLGYFSRIRASSVWYLSIEEKGDTAVVTPRGDDKVRFKMERADKGYWRITELILKNRL